MISATECETKRLNNGARCGMMPLLFQRACLPRILKNHPRRANSASRMLEQPRRAVACAFTEGGQHV